VTLAGQACRLAGGAGGTGLSQGRASKTKLRVYPGAAFATCRPSEETRFAALRGRPRWVGGLPRLNRPPMGPLAQRGLAGCARRWLYQFRFDSALRHPPESQTCREWMLFKAIASGRSLGHFALLVGWACASALTSTCWDLGHFLRPGARGVSLAAAVAVWPPCCARPVCALP